MSLKIYEYKACSTCKKALKYLDAKGIAYEKIAIREQAPSIEELRTMLTSMGNLKKLFNTSGVVYRAEGIKDKLPNLTEEQSLELLSDGNLVKRPFLIGDNIATVGFKEETWDEIFK